MVTDIVILAAGQGSRMRSKLPKVLHTLAGKPLAQHVIDQAKQLPNCALHLVVGHGADTVKSALVETPCQFHLQTEQLGTGHAVAQAQSHLSADGITLILYGDVPLTPASILEHMLAIAKADKLALLTVELDNPTGYGRILRNSHDEVIGIIEQKDASAEQLNISEVNTGILALPTNHLTQWLPQLSANNAQGEYYLTDLIAIAAKGGVPIETVNPNSEYEVQGVNNRRQLAELERWFQLQQANQLMDAGVTLADPTRVDVRGTLTAGQDTFIDVNFIAEGKVVLGNNVNIGPNCTIINSFIGDEVEILANTHIEGATIANSCQLGPFARIRPDSTLAPHVKVGNFVETKKANIGQGSKLNHLSYIGDAQIGRDVNVGAGTITCNYDGVNKSLTEIGDKAFIGSNSSLVAPVKIGAGTLIGAGSVINATVEENQLAIARAKQRNISGYKRPTKKD